MNIKSLSNNNAVFPNRLHDLHDTPSKLFLSGELDTNRPLLAVVGSRKASNYSKQVMGELLGPIVRSGVGIISGLAFGVDSMSHKIALENNGYTMAVLPSGLPEIYPRNHQYLAKEIIQCGGCLISESTASKSIRKHHFLQRNRIIAAMADAVLVVEAAERSGTLSTVRHALDLGRDVLAVPGPINSPYSKGTNRLIQLGAEAILSSEDLAYLLGIELGDNIGHWGENKQEQAIIDLLVGRSSSVEQLAVEVEMEPSELQQLLTALELRGIVRSLGAQVYELQR